MTANPLSNHMGHGYLVLDTKHSVLTESRTVPRTLFTNANKSALYSIRDAHNGYEYFQNVYYAMIDLVFPWKIIGGKKVIKNG